jgi:hypothetical protein
MRAVLSFPAGHQNANSWCGEHAHGHWYTVICTWDREGFAATDLETWVLYRKKALDLTLELKDRDLTKMLGPQVPNAFGVATFFMERLAIASPIRTVEVHEDDTHGPVAVIERETDY